MCTDSIWAERGPSTPHQSSFPLHHTSSNSIMASTTFNVVTLFTAHFHERRGPEIPFALPAGAEASLSNLEWKALPSGSHAIERGDTLLFLTADEDEKRVVLAVFSNRKTEAGEAETRGNRMVAVGAVLGESLTRAHLVGGRGWELPSFLLQLCTEACPLRSHLLAVLIAA